MSRHQSKRLSGAILRRGKRKIQNSRHFCYILYIRKTRTGMYGRQSRLNRMIRIVSVTVELGAKDRKGAFKCPLRCRWQLEEL